MEGEAGGIILRNAARQILLLRARPDAQMQAMAQRLCVMARERFGLRLAVGTFGGLCSSAYEKRPFFYASDDADSSRNGL